MNYPWEAAAQPPPPKARLSLLRVTVVCQKCSWKSKLCRSMASGESFTILCPNCETKLTGQWA